MNTIDIRDTNFTQANFWMICGPFSAGIVILALLVAFRLNVLKFFGFHTLVERQESKTADQALKLKRRVTDQIGIRERSRRWEV